MSVSVNKLEEIANVVCVLKPMASDCSVKLKTGQSLGGVQSIKVEAGVGNITTALIETICNEVEVEVLERDTKLIIEIKDQDAYQAGRDYVSICRAQAISNPYPEGSYGAYLFQKGVKDKQRELNKE